MINRPNQLSRPERCPLIAKMKIPIGNPPRSPVRHQLQFSIIGQQRRRRIRRGRCIGQIPRQRRAILIRDAARSMKPPAPATESAPEPQRMSRIVRNVQPPPRVRRSRRLRGFPAAPSGPTRFTSRCASSLPALNSTITSVAPSHRQPLPRLAYPAGARRPPSSPATPISYSAGCDLICDLPLRHGHRSLHRFENPHVARTAA